jgi:hypothetical protein
MKYQAPQLFSGIAVDRKTCKQQHQSWCGIQKNQLWGKDLHLSSLIKVVPNMK